MRHTAPVLLVVPLAALTAAPVAAEGPTHTATPPASPGFALLKGMAERHEELRPRAVRPFSLADVRPWPIRAIGTRGPDRRLSGRGDAFPAGGSVSFALSDPPTDAGPRSLSREWARAITLTARGASGPFGGAWRWTDAGGDPEGRVFDVRYFAALRLDVRLADGECSPDGLRVSLLGRGGAESGGVRLDRYDAHWSDGLTHRLYIPLADLLRDARGVARREVTGFALRGVGADAGGATFRLEVTEVSFTAPTPDAVAAGTATPLGQFAAERDEEMRRDRVPDVIRTLLRPGMTRQEVESRFGRSANSEEFNGHAVFSCGLGVDAHVTFDRDGILHGPVRFASSSRGRIVSYESSRVPRGTVTAGGVGIIDRLLEVPHRSAGEQENGARRVNRAP